MFTVGQTPWNKKEITWDIKQNGCWHCTSHKPNSNGYPRCTWKKKETRISHIMYERHIGPIPEGKHILHHCDNPICINPQHLFAGTFEDNMQDKINKKRHSLGERHPQAKITEKQAKEILTTIGIYQDDLAKKYGISQAAISAIKQGKRWKHLFTKEVI